MLSPGPGHCRWLYNLFVSVKNSLKTPELGYVTGAQLDCSTNLIPTKQPMKLARTGTSNTSIWEKDMFNKHIYKGNIVKESGIPVCHSLSGASGRQMQRILQVKTLPMGLQD